MESCISPDPSKLVLCNWTSLTGLSDLWKDKCIIVNYSQKSILR